MQPGITTRPAAAAPAGGDAAAVAAGAAVASGLSQAVVVVLELDGLITFSLFLFSSSIEME